MDQRSWLALTLSGAMSFGLVWGLWMENSLAQTPRIQGQGAAAAGMGNAFTAQADDPSALHYNPAGMTQLRGVQTMVGALTIGGVTDYRNPSTGATATGDRGSSVAWPLPGHFYLTANLKDLGITALGDLTAGIGVTSPFGSLTRYPDNTFAGSAYFITNPLIDIKPTVAYKVSDQLSLGLGADIYTYSGLFGDGHVEQHFTAGGARREINGRDTTAGFNVSLMYTPLRNADGKPLASIGLVYRSQAALHLKGQFMTEGAVTSNAAATLVLPQIYQAGVALWPVRDRQHEWKLELDVDYVGWRSTHNQNVALNPSVPGFGNLIASPANWSNGYTVMVGTEYKWLQLDRLPDWEVALRAGYMNQQTQMPDQTFSPTVPSSNTHIPSVGLGLLCKEHGSLFGWLPCGDIGIGSAKIKAIGLDLAYQAAFYEDRTITTNNNPNVNGIYKTMIHVGAFSLRFNF